MARRRRLPEADVDRRRLENEAQQLGSRLRLIRDFDGATYEPLERGLDAARALPDARERLAALIELADAIEPELAARSDECVPSPAWLVERSRGDVS